MEPAIRISNVSVTLTGSVQALKNLNVDLPKRKIIGFIGPSGAGKTTLVRSIVGRQKLSDGEITVFGLTAGAPRLRSQMSYMTQQLSVYPDLTIAENLKYFATMSGERRQNLERVVSKVLHEVDLLNTKDRLVSDLSGGQKQRVSLAIALIGSPKLLVLDEPTVGLDPVLRNSIWELFNTLKARGATIIVSSHSMDEAERCDDLVLLREGTIIAHATPTDLMKKTTTRTIEASFLKLVGAETA